MNTADRLPEVFASGSPQDLGYQHGRQAANQIRSLYEYRISQVRQASPDGPGTGETELEVLARAESYIGAVEEHAGELLEEVHGLARGSGLSFTQAFFLQVATEVRLSRADGCSALGFRRRADPVLAQNWDQPPQSAGKQVVLHLQPRDKPEIVMFGHAGAIGYIGLNELGLGQVNTQLYRRQTATGLGHYFVSRALLGFGTLAEATDWLARVPIAATVSYLVGDAQGSLGAFELGGGGAVELPRDAIQMHTNHYVDAGLSRNDWSGEPLPDSVPRLQRLHALTDGLALMPEDVLSDHHGYPRSLCRHDSPSGLATAASVILRLRQRVMSLAYGPPCTTPYQSYTLSGGRP